MNFELIYPHGKTKAITFSYDDGSVSDRKLVEIFNNYGVKGTFHLNSGKLSQTGYVSKDEVKSLYQGHEIACHGVEHKYLRHLSQDLLVKEIWEDRRNLEKLTGEQTLGMSYAFGEYDDEIVNTLQVLGIQYSRTVESTNEFSIPDDFIRWKPTCHHNENILEKAKLFLSPPEYMKLPLFYIWGHSFEFDRENNWELIEEFCKQISFKEDIWYTTNIEYSNYVKAMKKLIFNVENTCVLNPTAYPIYIKMNGVMKKLEPGKKVDLL